MEINTNLLENKDPLNRIFTKNMVYTKIKKVGYATNICSLNEMSRINVLANKKPNKKRIIATTRDKIKANIPGNISDSVLSSRRAS